MDVGSGARPFDFWSKLFDLASNRYELYEVANGVAPAQFFMAIPKSGASDQAAWLPPAARPAEGRTPSGGGLSREKAMAACLGEAAELISSCRWGQEPVFRATASQLGEAALLPCDLLLISERQYELRDRWNGAHGDYAWLPEPYDPSASIDWVKATSPGRTDTRFVPAAYALIGHSNAGEQGCFCVSDSNGCAAAPSLDQAIARGFLELVERDGTAIWWYGRHRRPEVDMRTVSGLGALLDWLNERRRKCHVLDIAADLTVPVFAAVSYEPDGSVVALGFGADFDPDRAVLSALLEMCQMEISFELLRQQAPEQADSAFGAWIEAVDLGTCGPCQPLSDPPIDLEGYRAGQGGRSGTDLERCLELCAAHDLKLYYLDLTREEIGIPVARAIVPGLRHYKPRFAEGRLYDVPVKLGWRPDRLAETSLNPLPLIV